MCGYCTVYQYIKWFCSIITHIEKKNSLTKKENHLFISPVIFTHLQCLMVGQNKQRDTYI